MDNDLISLLIYVALGLVGVIASAYKNKMKKQQMEQHFPKVPGTFTAEPAKDLKPDFGPLMELFDIPVPKQEPVFEYETIESGKSVEEEGMLVDSAESALELAGMKVDSNVSELEKIPEVELFEEGQSDIQKMIAKYEAVRKELEYNGIGDDIASSEIVSVEVEEAAKLKRDESREFFDLRKAIIYSEILKRKEY